MQVPARRGRPDAGKVVANYSSPSKGSRWQNFPGDHNLTQGEARNRIAAMPSEKRDQVARAVRRRRKGARDTRRGKLVGRGGRGRAEEGQLRLRNARGNFRSGRRGVEAIGQNRAAVRGQRKWPHRRSVAQGLGASFRSSRSSGSVLLYEGLDSGVGVALRPAPDQRRTSFAAAPHSPEFCLFPPAVQSHAFGLRRGTIQHSVSSS